MIRPWSLFVGALVLSCIELSAISAAAQTSSTASSVATAGAGRASVEAGDVHDLNPAMLVHVRDRDFHTATLKNGWIAGITDNSEDSLLPAGLAYSLTKENVAGGEMRTTDLRLSLASFVRRNLSFGLTGKQMAVDLGEMQWKRINADAGLTWIATPKLGVALVVSDVLSRQDDLPDFMKPRSRTAVGLQYLYRETLRLRADVVSAVGNDMNHPSVLLGYESELTQYLTFRLGYGVEREKDREIGAAGLGFNLPKFRLNYGLQWVAKGEREDLHSIDLGIPF